MIELREIKHDCSRVITTSSPEINPDVSHYDGIQGNHDIIIILYDEILIFVLILHMRSCLNDPVKMLQLLVMGSSAWLFTSN